MGAEDAHKYSVFTYLLEELNKLDPPLAYVHMVRPRLVQPLRSFHAASIAQLQASIRSGMCPFTLDMAYAALAASRRPG